MVFRYASPYGQYGYNVAGQKQALVSFATNPVLSSFIGKIIFFVQFDILVSKYSEGGYFLKMKQILGQNYCRKQIELKNIFKIMFNNVKFQLLTPFFLVH